MRDRAIGAFRLLLTITGFVLLVVFGSRAAHDASSMKAAGATDGRRAIATMLGIRLLLGLNNPYAVVPSVNGAAADHAATADRTHTKVATPKSVTTPEAQSTARRPSTLPDTASQSHKPQVLGTQALQSIVDKVTSADNRPVQVLDVPKTIINDTLDKDVTDSLAPITNNLPIVHHLLL
jgi:hypothetical protein